jgi:hypothetical protein
MFPVLPRPFTPYNGIIIRDGTLGHSTGCLMQQCPPTSRSKIPNGSKKSAIPHSASALHPRRPHGHDDYPASVKLRQSSGAADYKGHGLAAGMFSVSRPAERGVLPTSGWMSAARTRSKASQAPRSHSLPFPDPAHHVFSPTSSEADDRTVDIGEYSRLQVGPECAGRLWTMEIPRGQSLSEFIERCDGCVGRAIEDKKEAVRCTVDHVEGGYCSYGRV